MRIDKIDVITGALYLLGGIAFASASLRYGLGTSVHIGAGYFPMLVGIGLSLVGLVILLNAIRSGEPQSFPRFPLRPLVAVAGGVATFGLLINSFGFFPSVVGLLTVSSFATPENSIKNIIVLISVLLPITYFVFIFILKMPIPFIVVAG